MSEQLYRIRPIEWKQVNSTFWCSKDGRIDICFYDDCNCFAAWLDNVRVGSFDTFENAEAGCIEKAMSVGSLVLELVPSPAIEGKE